MDTAAVDRVLQIRTQEPVFPHYVPRQQATRNRQLSHQVIIVSSKK